MNAENSHCRYSRVPILYAEMPIGQHVGAGRSIVAFSLFVLVLADYFATSFEFRARAST